MSAEKQELDHVGRALLTNAEIKWLKRKKSDNVSRYVKSRLIKKLRQFQLYELPLLINSGLWDATTGTAPMGFVWSEGVSEQSVGRAVLASDCNVQEQVLSRRRSRVQWNARLALDPNKSRPEHSFSDRISSNGVDDFSSFPRTDDLDNVAAGSNMLQPACRLFWAAETTDF